MYKTPFKFDGHGINDAESTRLATLNTAMHLYDTGQPKHNPEHDALGELFAAAPDLLSRLRTLEGLATAINAQQHAGIPIEARQWADPYQECREARALIAKQVGRS